MSMNSPEPLLNWLTKHFDGKEHAASRRKQLELANSTEWIVRLYLAKENPLRPAQMAKKLASLATNLRRASKAAKQLSEDGTDRVLLASEARNAPEEDEA